MGGYIVKCKEDGRFKPTEQALILIKGEMIYRQLKNKALSTQSALVFWSTTAALSSVWLNEDGTFFSVNIIWTTPFRIFTAYQQSKPHGWSVKWYQDKIELEKARVILKNRLVNGKGKDQEKWELIPVGQLETKDAFSRMKNVTACDILSTRWIW